MTHNHEAGPGTRLALVLTLAVTYEVTASRHRWPSARTAAFLGGCPVLAVGPSANLSPWPAGDFRAHMLQNLLFGMIAPLGLVLAPITLVLRTVPRGLGRRLGRLLHQRALRPLVHPVTALVLSVGGFAAFYATPLFRGRRLATLHGLMTIHFLLAGSPVRLDDRRSPPGAAAIVGEARLVVLGVAVAAHAILSQLLYAGSSPRSTCRPRNARAPPR